MQTLTTRTGRLGGRHRPVLLTLALMLAVVAAVPPALADPSASDPGPATSGTDPTSSTSGDPIASADAGLQPRIFNGVPASIDDLPAVVFIANQTNGGTCTGTIIAPRWVLTAAHCFNASFTDTTPNPPEILVLGGRDTFSNQATDWPEFHLAEAGIHHPSWNPLGDAAAHDIALLRLATPSSIPPMALAAAGPPDHVGQQATVTGWGITQDDPVIDTDVLRRATVDVRPHADCETQWGWQYDRNWLVCAGGGPASSDACSGDSGGPLLLESGGTQTLIGVVNSGELCTPASQQNGIYTGVAAYRTWIDQTIGSASDDPGDPDPIDPDPGDPIDPDPGDPDPGDPDAPTSDADFDVVEVEISTPAAGRADLVLVQGIPGAEVDILANGTALAEALTYGRIALRSGLQPGDYNVEVIADGASLLQTQLTLPPDGSVSVAAYLDVDGRPTLDAWSNATDVQPGLQVFHLAQYPAIDIGVTGLNLFMVENLANGSTQTVDLRLASISPGMALPAEVFLAGQREQAAFALPVVVPDDLGLLYVLGPAAADPGQPGDPTQPTEPGDPTEPSEPDDQRPQPDPERPPPPSFVDVPADYVHASSIGAVAAAGITTGCTTTRFCPGDSVTRAQMATFLRRALDLPAGPVAPFVDLDRHSVHAPGIDAVAAAGITAGCTATRFCPGEFVTRAQMASFLARAFALPAGPDAGFVDVAPTNVHAPGINAVAAAGITTGFPDGSFGPSLRVTRGQMAAFLDRAALQHSPTPDPDAPATGALRVTTEQLPVGARGLSYAATLEADGGEAPHRWEVSGLPDGLSATEAGRVSGLVLEEGSWPVQVTVEDDEGQQAQTELLLVIEDVGVPEECIGRDCALLEPFDGSPTQIGEDLVDWRTFELQAGQVEDVEVQGSGLDELGQPEGFAQLTVRGLTDTPGVGDVLVVHEDDHPEGFAGSLIVQAEQVLVLEAGRIAVAGPLVGLMSAYHSGVLHLRDAETVLLDEDGQPLTDAEAAARSGPLRCEGQRDEVVEVGFTPAVDGDVYVRWQWGVPQEVEVTAEVGMETSLRVALSGQIECQVTDIPPLKVAKGPVIFGLGTSIRFGANAAFDGSVTASMSCSTTFGYNRGAPAHFGCASGPVGFALAAGEDDNQAEAWLTAALTPSISLAKVVGVTGSMGTTFRAHLTPLDTPQALLTVEIPTKLEGCIGCALPLVGTLLETTFIDETYGPRTVWSRTFYEVPEPEVEPEPDEPADPEPFNVTAQGIEGAPPASQLVDWLTQRLGTPSEDTGWFLEECTGEGELRWVTWGSFTIALERSGGTVSYEAAQFTLDAQPPPGPQLPAGFSPGMTWGQAQQFGAVLDEFYGYYEVPGELLFGNVANSDWPPLASDPLANVIIGLPGAFYIAGC